MIQLIVPIQNWKLIFDLTDFEEREREKKSERAREKANMKDRESKKSHNGRRKKGRKRRTLEREAE